ncbi:hypothetical protein SAMN05216489_01860 [Streptomyces sp. 3213]|uniref:hypothetical protein n=1 Tax=Streptomyces sp. 3213.3 TaxID=1855348 RepID=UPI00089C41B8|nr:hypothetical protein [Streptomyces sp. 3213.3]SEC87795.1 hypothetical protein SAMN05216489_01860 [Streptomyces sp. 3213] [Streptomyces sp. 3213.3]
MGTRVERQWRDRPSGPPYQQRVLVHDEDDGTPTEDLPGETPAQAAYRHLVTHASGCRACKAVNADGWADGTCPPAQDLYQTWRRLWHPPTQPEENRTA